MFSFLKNVWGDLVALNAPEPIQNISPDAMIVGGLMQSFATEFDDWQLDWCKLGYNGHPLPDKISNFPKDLACWAPKSNWSERDSYPRIFSLTNKKKKIIFIIEYTYCSYYSGSDNYKKAMKKWQAKINDVEIDGKAGRELADAYISLKEKHDSAKSITAKALAEMKANEAKWNIAEQILGMKRTKSGRLIAVSSYCAVCDSIDPDKEAEKLHNLSCPNRPQLKPRRPKVVKNPLGKAEGPMCSNRQRSGTCDIC